MSVEAYIYILNRVDEDRSVLSGTKLNCNYNLIIKFHFNFYICF